LETGPTNPQSQTQECQEAPTGHQQVPTGNHDQHHQGGHKQQINLQQTPASTGHHQQQINLQQTQDSTGHHQQQVNSQQIQATGGQQQQVNSQQTQAPIGRHQQQVNLQQIQAPTGRHQQQINSQQVQATGGYQQQVNSQQIQVTGEAFTGRHYQQINLQQTQAPTGRHQQQINSQQAKGYQRIQEHQQVLTEHQQQYNYGLPNKYNNNKTPSYNTNRPSLPINNLNSKSTISKVQLIEESSEDGFSDDDETFFSLTGNLCNNTTSHKKSHRKDVYDSPTQPATSFNTSQSIEQFIGNTSYINNPLSITTTQQNICTTDSSTRSGLFFQDENHLIQWLESRKDIILQVLNSIFSLHNISNQVIIAI
jgi:hypothetical protein